MCGHDIPVAVTVDDGEMDYELPEGHMGCGPFSFPNTAILANAIIEATREAHEAHEQLYFAPDCEAEFGQ
jgi:hypothetical protein